MNTEHRPKTALFQNVKERLATLEGAKDFYAEVIELHAQGVITSVSMKNLLYAMNGYLAYLKTEKELDIEKRLELIEQALESEK